LVAADQFPERCAIVGDEHTGDQFGIGHDCGGRPAGGLDLGAIERLRIA
jgi:hypothetical protein